MPAQDGDFMLRDGSVAVSGNETGDGVLVGPCPLNGMLLLIHVPTGSPDFTVEFQESSDDGDSDAYADCPAPGDQAISEIGTKLLRAFWSEDWVRYKISSYSATGGLVEISLVQGGEPN
ncbi:MAG: hypothetical protein ABIH46_01600 [Chloroflexota bacterium]